MSGSAAYNTLVTTFTKLYRYQHLQMIAGWDQAAMMPSKGNDARGAAMAELAVLMHNTLTAPHLNGALTAAKAEVTDGVERASLREMERQWQVANLLPADLVEAKSLAGSRCEHAWRTQRKANDWQGFLVNFREVVKYTRQEATLLAEATGLSKYDALVAKYEPGMNGATIERMFNELKQWLPGLIKQVQAKPACFPSSNSVPLGSKSWGCWALISKLGALMFRRIRFAAASPKTCASPRAIAKMILCKR